MGSPYVLPVPGATKKRSDQGQDYQGRPGQHVLAIGRARVDAIHDDPGGFGKVIYYTLLDGPAKGTQIYVGHAQPTVHAGQTVAAGAPVATLLKSGLGNAAGLPGWTEVGVAKNNTPLLHGKGATGGAELLDQVIHGATSQPDGVASGSDTTGVVSSPAVAPPPAATLPTDAGLPGASGLEPVGSQQFVPHQIAQLWQQVAQDDFVSPDTLKLIQNASISGG